MFILLHNLFDYYIYSAVHQFAAVISCCFLSYQPQLAMTGDREDQGDGSEDQGDGSVDPLSTPRFSGKSLFIFKTSIKGLDRS